MGLRAIQPSWLVNSTNSDKPVSKRGKRAIFEISDKKTTDIKGTQMSTQTYTLMGTLHT